MTPTLSLSPTRHCLTFLISLTCPKSHFCTLFNSPVLFFTLSCAYIWEYSHSLCLLYCKCRLLQTPPHIQNTFLFEYRYGLKRYKKHQNVEVIFESRVDRYMELSVYVCVSVKGPEWIITCTNHHTSSVWPDPLNQELLHVWTHTVINRQYCTGYTKSCWECVAGWLQLLGRWVIKMYVTVAAPWEKVFTMELTSKCE